MEKQSEFALLSTKNIDFSKKYRRGEKKVTGKDLIKIYYLIPTKWYPDPSTAVQDALATNCAEYLSDVKLTYRQEGDPRLFYSKVSFVVEGYPWYLEGGGEQNCRNIQKERVDK